jgi:hypothetical protein
MKRKILSFSYLCWGKVVATDEEMIWLPLTSEKTCLSLLSFSSISNWIEGGSSWDSTWKNPEKHIIALESLYPKHKLHEFLSSSYDFEYFTSFPFSFPRLQSTTESDKLFRHPWIALMQRQKALESYFYCGEDWKLHWIISNYFPRDYNGKSSVSPSVFPPPRERFPRSKVKATKQVSARMEIVIVANWHIVLWLELVFDTERERLCRINSLILIHRQHSLKRNLFPSAWA